MKKMLALALAVTMGLSLAACGGKDAAGSTAGTPEAAEGEDSTADTETPASAEDTAASGEAKYTVGICQLVQHEALDAATQGFMDGLTEALGGEEAVEFDLQNAQNDSNTCSTIINSFVSGDVDLILANATPALQAAQAGTNEIPILGTSVTEYGVALGIDGFDGTVGGNISGTSDLAPLKEQAAMLQELFPDAKNVGLVYCTTEANSKYQVDEVQKALEELGYTCKQYEIGRASCRERV